MCFPTVSGYEIIPSHWQVHMGRCIFHEFLLVLHMPNALFRISERGAGEVQPTQPPKMKLSLGISKSGEPEISGLHAFFSSHYFYGFRLWSWVVI